MPENCECYGGEGTRVDEMLPPEELKELIRKLTPSPESQRQRFTRRAIERNFSVPMGVEVAELEAQRGETSSEQQ